MSTTTIEIEGMHCDGCAQRVRRALERESGVEAAEVSYAAGEARVEFDDGTTTTDRLREVIQRAGYTATASA